MGNSELIADIKENFERLNDRKNQTVKQVLNAIIASISRLNVSSKDDNLHLLKIIADLKDSEEAESQFFKLNNPGSKNTEYSESFYQSVNILKQELFGVLNKL